MKRKYIINLILLLMLSSCGFTPIYKEFKNKQFNFNITEINGNDEMNNFTIIQLNSYSNNSSDKIYDLKINTDYSKSILSKNLVGEVTNYLLVTKIEFEIINLEINNKFLFQDETKTENISNKLELKNYEKSVINNFITSAIKEFVLKISTAE
tara:strand:+ start:701 stop:1159 length:459 start_codon:yes stop_codon:yes gene_type:complete